MDMRLESSFVRVTSKGNSFLEHVTIPLRRYGWVCNLDTRPRDIFPYGDMDYMTKVLLF